MNAAATSRGLPEDLWSGTGGFLRRVVDVQPGRDAWRLRYSIWELEIPTCQVETDPALRGFLERRSRIKGLRLGSEGATNLIHLLGSQGCTTYDGAREDYTLDEVRFIVGALASHWYGLYYSHPFWTELRNCRHSIPQVFGWALRTYHLSRSAGPTAARGAVHSPRPHIRKAFLKSALEEYSHCDIYYFPEHEVFGLDREWVKALLPTPSSTAFDQHMAVMAEDDWLAHAISAYFQEYTAAFRENAFALYDRVEKFYGLTGFFKGWKDHIGYDVHQTHADEFEDLFAGSERIGKPELLRSLDLASVTVEYLIGALDELSALPADVALDAFRVSPSLLERGATRTTVLGGIDAVPAALDFATCSTLARSLTGITSSRFGGLGVIAGTLEGALSPTFLADASTRALSLAVEHDDIILLGAVVESLEANAQRASNIGPETGGAGFQAIRNFFREISRDSSEFIFILGLFDSILRDTPGAHGRVIFGNGTESRWCIWSSAPATRERSVRLASLGLRFLELADAAGRMWRRLDALDLFEPSPFREPRLGGLDA